MKQFFKNNLWVMYLGAALAANDIRVTETPIIFFIIIVPTILLVTWTQN